MNLLLPRRTLHQTPLSICSRCLRQCSPNVKNSATRSYSTRPPAPPPTGLTRLAHRRLISLTGRDAPKFLQGLTTNNVDPKRRVGWYSSFLNAQGRILWEGFVYPIKQSKDDSWGYLIEVEDTQIKSLLSHLKRHKLRSKVAFQEIPADETTVWAGWTDDLQLESKMEIDEGTTPETGITHLVDPRLLNFGHRFLVPGTTPSDQAKEQYPLLLAAEANADSYKLRRYLNGIAEGPAEIVPEHALPHESNFDHLNGIDFRKGCYVGQELTIRTQHTGVVRKRVLPVQLYSKEGQAPSTLSYDPDSLVDAETVEVGTNIKATGSKRAAGKFLAGIGNIGLGVCRLEMMTDMRVSAEGGTYKEGTEFWVGDSVKIKAFVPGWLQEREMLRGAVKSP